MFFVILLEFGSGPRPGNFGSFGLEGFGFGSLSLSLVPESQDSVRLLSCPSRVLPAGDYMRRVVGPPTLIVI